MTGKEVETTPTVNPEVIDREVFGFGEIVRERVIIAGKPVLLTTIYASDNARFFLKHDPFFVLKGIATEPTGLLISQAETEKLWGNPAGLTPENFMESMDGEVLGVCPSNAGWQRNAFWINDGVMLAVDKSTTGKFDIIGRDSYIERWSTTKVVVSGGKIEEGEIDGISVGFSMPLIVDEGEVVPIIEIINDPRLVADLRNVFDFAAEKKLSPEFWLLLRKLLPASGEAGRVLLTPGGQLRIMRPGVMNREEIAKFKEIIEKAGLSDYLDTGYGSIPTLEILKTLPMQKVPVVGVGFNREGKLIITAVDGRQPDSAGATIEELGQIMKDRGAVCAGLGCAGGDVAVVHKNTSGLFEMLNSPSNVDATGKRVTRRVPSLLILR